MPRLLLALLPALLLTGCFEKVAESRVKAALVGAGLSESNAACMAGRMVDRLSIGQLRSLEKLRKRAGETGKDITIGEYVSRVRKAADAEAIAVTVSSAALCSVGLG